MDLKELQKLIMEQAREKKWGTTPDEISVGDKIALLHSEVSEAFEAYRHNNIDGKHGFKEELGDIIHRALHLCGIFDVDIEQRILHKIEENKKRDWTGLNEG